MPPAFVYYSCYILKHDFRQDLVWYIATSEIVVCPPFILFLGLDCAGTSASIPGDSLVLSVKKGILFLLSLLLRSHIKQYTYLNCFAIAAMIWTSAFFLIAFFMRLIGVAASLRGILTTSMWGW